MVQVRMIAQLAQRYSIAARMPMLRAAPDWPLDGCPAKYLGVQATFYVDAIAVGKGLGDRLNELGYFTVLFNAARKCRHENDALVFANEKARVHYRFREMLIAGEIGIPDDHDAPAGAARGVRLHQPIRQASDRRQGQHPAAARSLT
jgi:hypothetical protein